MLQALLLSVVEQLLLLTGGHKLPVDARRALLFATLRELGPVYEAAHPQNLYLDEGARGGSAQGRRRSPSGSREPSSVPSNEAAGARPAMAGAAPAAGRHPPDGLVQQADQVIAALLSAPTTPGRSMRMGLASRLGAARPPSQEDIAEARATAAQLINHASAHVGSLAAALSQAQGGDSQLPPLAWGVSGGEGAEAVAGSGPAAGRPASRLIRRADSLSVLRSASGQALDGGDGTPRGSLLGALQVNNSCTVALLLLKASRLYAVHLLDSGPCNIHVFACQFLSCHEDFVFPPPIHAEFLRLL